MQDAWAAIQAAAAKVLAPKAPGHADPPRYALDRALRVIRAIDRLAPLTPDSFPHLHLARAAALYATIAQCGCHTPAGTPSPHGQSPANGQKPNDDQGLNDAIELASDQLKSILPPDDLDLLTRILREHRRRHTSLPEARLLADALCLEEFGLIGFWHQLRAFHAASKSPEQLLKLWKAQHDYGYWDTRLRDGFHYPAARAVAHSRLDHMQSLFDRLQLENACEDLPAPTNAPALNH
ncbi:MAG TPA: hypothetical protein VH253_07305 [Phycisphaerae bacterium]|nr:hypothetical protein [Phycisphaerae bacterium]